METQLVQRDAISDIQEAIRKNAEKIRAQTTPERFKKKRKAKGGGYWTYVKADFLEDELDKYFPGWSCETLDWEAKGTGDNQFIVARVQLTVFDNGLKRVMTQNGGQEVKYYSSENPRSGDLLDFANDVKAAETDAFKRCCYKLGFIRDIKYDPADLDISEEQWGLLLNVIENGKEEWKEGIKDYAYQKLNRANFDDFMKNTILPVLEKHDGNEDKVEMLRKKYGVFKTEYAQETKKDIDEAIKADKFPGSESAASEAEDPPWEEPVDTN